MRHSIVLRSLAFVLLTALSTDRLHAAMLTHWSLDNGTSGLVNNGTAGAASDLANAPALGAIVGGPTFVETGGILGGYASFNGTQALIGNVTGNAAELLTQYPLTLSAWVRVGVTQVDRGAIVGMINRGASDQYLTLGTEPTAEGKDLQAVRRPGTFHATEAPNTNATLTDGAWHHVAAVYHGPSALRLYMDGVQVGMSTVTMALPTGLNTLSIGAQRRSAGYIDRFTGDVDEVQIYDEGLVASQISWLFENPGMGPPPEIQGCDVNESGTCDMVDLQIIADNFYKTVSTRGEGDLNADGIVNFADFRLWKEHPLTIDLSAGVNVPEPSATWICLLAAYGITGRAWRQDRK
ncbi:LamG-like jellyroll fold domain-containing protein [Aeoliella sp. SH292]|uniref:LamG-like jellyroll fold domain-containing protein n=1 Tax=Aeoliella sp. SH292 TaxID=3454464 RepID=UPI003F959388